MSERPLSERFRRHADAIVRADRSPLSTALMYAAAADLDNGGVVTDVFAGVAAPPGSVPQLRLLAALHHLVLAGRAPDLAVASEPQLLAWCGDHGPPVVWVHVAGPPV